MCELELLKSEWNNLQFFEEKGAKVIQKTIEQNFGKKEERKE